LDGPDPPARGLRERLGAARAGLAFGAFALLVSVALGALARHETRHQLAGEASLALAALARGDSIHEWALRTPNDVIAGRAFGTDAIRFDDQGLHVRSNGAPIEVGMVVRGTLDLVRHPLLHADLRAMPPALLSIVVRETLEAPICEGARGEVAHDHDGLVIDLAALQWTCAGQPATPPSRAAMLRFRLQLPADAEATLRDVALRPSAPIDIARIAPRAIVAAADARAVMDAAARDSSAADVFPVWTLTFDDLRVEQVLAARDAVRRVVPGALVVIADDWARVVARAAESPPAARASTMVAWTGTGLLVAGLLVLRLRPPRSTRVRATVELVGVLAAPLIFVLGSGFGDDIGAVWWVALGATLAFAASLMVGEAPPPLVAGGARRRGWLVAAASVLGALALALILRDADHVLAWPTPARVARYVAWATVQQVLISVVVSALAERALHSSRAALLVAATAFALLHSPNAMLMQLTFVGGLLWVWNWQRHRALLANIVAHATSGLLLAAALPADWLRSAEVGARYFLF
jgi:hypothetical protein